MAPRNPALWLGNRDDHTAAGYRLTVGAMTWPFDTITDEGDLLKARSGNVLAPKTEGADGARHDPMEVYATSTPSMDVIVHTGTTVIQGTESDQQGAYTCHNDGPYLVSLDPSDPTNDRIDLVVARVFDSFYSDPEGLGSLWALNVVTGSPGVSPQPPDPPRNSHVKATVTVSASATEVTNADIDNRISFTTSRGGTLPVFSPDEISNPYLGMTIFERPTKRLLVWNGTEWTGELDPFGEPWIHASAASWRLVDESRPQPDIGNGIFRSHFKKIGRVVFWNFRMIWGTTTFGGQKQAGGDYPGSWLFRTPVQAEPGSGISLAGRALNFSDLTEGVSRVVTAFDWDEDGQYVILVSSGDNGERLDAETPWHWDAATRGDELNFAGIYEASNA